MACQVNAAPDMPSSLIINGDIAPGVGLLSTRPANGDSVLAFSVADRQLVGLGPVDGSGSYSAILMRTSSFNGSQVVLELQQGRKRYALLNKDGTSAIFQFYGGMLPERITMPLRVGQKTAELSAQEAENPRAQRLSMRADMPCTADADVNEDGRCDELDIEILGLYGGGVSRTIGKP